jgi:hypothetical protein
MQMPALAPDQCAFSTISKHSTAEQLGMSARSHEVDPVRLNLVDEQKVAANVALPVIGPIAFQGVIQPLSAKGRSVCNQQHHRLFEAPHVIAPGMR